jgi:Protein of unknown function (DUF1566)
MARWQRWSRLVLLGLAVWWVVGASPAVEGQPGRYTQSPDGVITDQVTGLEWYINPNRDNTWLEARAWAAGLKVAGGGWRLPTLAELKALYQKNASAVHMDPLFRLPGAYVWSGDLRDPQFAWGFAFYSGLEGFHSVNYGFGRVALAVRSRK